MRALHFCLFLIILSFSTDSLATCYMPEMKSNRYHPNINIDKLLSQEKRLSFAKELTSRNKEIQKYIPRPSPSELKWIEEEISRNRYQVFSSSEYEQKAAHKWLDYHETLLTRIVDANEPIHQEVLLWAVLSSSLSQWNFKMTLQSLGQKHKIIPIPMDHVDMACIHNSRTIMARIVIPFIRGDSSE